ncbi:NUDIX hydrolase [Devosia algicola]|uniref:NUDIX hydrolase n=1 Tax=Devosia algicola TaxID=3026418 RepID=A0ABY7YN06_9HYPH|nr:NUDIX hydrolase [Devosia algicola]WDR02310.1 NUDIX hydrolase [Devosia algicola]
MNKLDRGSWSPDIDYAQQLAALPWRKTKSGKIEILMVTSRISQHWLLPKGWPMTGKSLVEAAAQEALEEAGVRGKMHSKPVGKYYYDKLMKDGQAVPCTVDCFALKANKLLDEWPEATQRERRWFTLPDAAAAVYEPDLARMLSSNDLTKKLSV